MRVSVAQNPEQSAQFSERVMARPLDTPQRFLCSLGRVIHHQPRATRLDHRTCTTDGKYKFKLSGKALTFKPIKDTCAVRRDVLTFGPWTKIG